MGCVLHSEAMLILRLWFLAWKVFHALQLMSELRDTQFSVRAALIYEWTVAKNVYRLSLACISLDVEMQRTGCLYWTFFSDRAFQNASLAAVLWNALLFIIVFLFMMGYGVLAILPSIYISSL